MLVRARRSDFGTLVDLAARLYEHDGLALQDASYRRALERLLSDERLGGAWLVDLAGRVVGYTVVTACYSLEFGGSFGLLDELFLVEEARGRGVGQIVLRELEKVCRRLGYGAVRLEVVHANGRARRFYESAGYTADVRTLMTKRLDATELAVSRHEGPGRLERR